MDSAFLKSLVFFGILLKYFLDLKLGNSMNSMWNQGDFGSFKKLMGPTGYDISLRATCQKFECSKSNVFS